MSNPSNIRRSGAAPRERSDLGKQYRAIGIGAVAAALAFTGEQKKKDDHASATPKVVKFGDFDLHVAQISAASGR
ncbi:MAG: hypothetical protein Q7S17_05715 [Xanthobacteraceae bacterium]|nr:hypothetical protein [Xanthobacteraceae bacterium]